MVTALLTAKSLLDAAGTVMTAKHLVKKGHEKIMQANEYLRKDDGESITVPILGDIGTPKKLIIKAVAVVVVGLVANYAYKKVKQTIAVKSATTDDYTRQAMDIKRKLGSWYEDSDEAGIYRILEESTDLKALNKRYSQLYTIDLLVDLQDTFSMEEYQKVLEITNTKSNSGTQVKIEKYIIFDNETVLWKNPSNFYLFGGKVNKTAPALSLLPFPVIKEVLFTYNYVLTPITYSKLPFLKVIATDELGKAHEVYVLKSVVNQISASDYNTKYKAKYKTQIRFNSKDFL